MLDDRCFERTYDQLSIKETVVIAYDGEDDWWCLRAYDQLSIKETVFKTYGGDDILFFEFPFLNSRNPINWSKVIKIDVFVNISMSFIWVKYQDWRVCVYL